MEREEYRDWLDLGGKLAHIWTDALMNDSSGSARCHIWTAIPVFMAACIYSNFVLEKNPDTGRYRVK